MKALTWILFLVAVSLTTGGSYFTTGDDLVMITESQNYVLTEGETLILMCDFQAGSYNLFDYPVLWKKTQHHEEFQINIMGNLNFPFVGTKRFDVSFSETPPHRRLELIIRDISPEDSGNYTCEVRGPRSTVVTSITHIVSVTAPVHSLTLTAGNSSGDPNIQQEEPIRHSRKTTMIENTLNTLRCTAHGGYPRPELTIKLDKVDITPQFHRKSYPHLSGRPGLRVITYTTEVWTDSFIPTSKADSTKLKCLASVSGLRSNSTALKLDIHYTPKLSCHPLSVVVWERNPVLRCEVYFKPELTNLFWILDSNGTTIKEGEVYEEFWILTSEKKQNYIESQLFMRQAKPENFRPYTIVAENNVGAESMIVELSERVRYPPSTPRPPMYATKATWDTYVSFSSASLCHSDYQCRLWIIICTLTLAWKLTDHR